MLIVVNQELVRAIREKRLIEFTYKSGGARVVEPHDYGVHRAAASLLGYQISGPSRSGVAHGWLQKSTTCGNCGCSIGSSLAPEPAARSTIASGTRCSGAWVEARSVVLTADTKSRYCRQSTS